MGALALNIALDEHVEEMLSYVCGYWYSQDIWRIEDKALLDRSAPQKLDIKNLTFGGHFLF